MKLPNVEHAIVDPAKIHDYLHSDTHPVGRFKAAFYRGIGYSVTPWHQVPGPLYPFGEPGALGSGRQHLAGRRGLAAAVHNCISGRGLMRYEPLDTVVLDRDLPEHGLRRGDLGAVVHVHEPDGLEVEFMTASGHTEALVTLTEPDVRPVTGADLVSVRTVQKSA